MGLPSDEDDRLFREDTLRLTGAALTTIGADAAATLADNFSTNAFTSLKFDLAANASSLFSAADGNLFVLADLAANASLTAIAFLTANICVASANSFLNAGSDVAATEDGTTVIGADAFGDDTFAAAAADTTAPLYLNPSGPGKTIGNAAGPPFATGDLILNLIGGLCFLLPLEDDHELFGDGTAAAFGDAAFGDAAFGDAAAAARGESNFIIGDADASESAEPVDDQCADHDFGDVPFDDDDNDDDDDDTDFAFGDAAFGDAFGDAAFGDAAAAARGESNFIIGDADASESAEPVDDQCADHDFGDVPFDDDDDDIVLDDVPLLEEFFEPDAAFDDTDGESNFIIGDADADFAFGDGATGTAPLDLNPSGPGKNTGS